MEQHIIDNNAYLQWLEHLCNEIDKQRLKAVMQLNAATLQHYWWLGNDIMQKQKEQGWGAKVIDQLSMDLQKHYGSDSGYSVRNLGYMKNFAAEYPDFPFLQVPLAKLQEMPFLQARLAKFTVSADGEFVQVPLAQITWYHHISMISKVASKVTDFLLELGRGFSYLGRQFPLNIAGEESKVDLMMYHTRLHCYVAIELKVTDFKPEFLSKLNYYISAIDDLVKMPEDNPTIGLLLCRSKNNTKVEYALRGMTQPLGVAEYQTNQIMEDLKSELPSIDDLENTIK